MPDVKLAELWQVEDPDGRSFLRVDIPVPPNLKGTIAHDTWRAYVYEAMREVLRVYDGRAPFEVPSEPHNGVTET